MVRAQSETLTSGKPVDAPTDAPTVADEPTVAPTNKVVEEPLDYVPYGVAAWAWESDRVVTTKT